MISIEDAYKIIRVEREKIPNLKVYDGEATVTLDDRSLSKGCQACKSGSWICIYVGEECNLSCDFCPQEDERHTKGKHDTWINGGNYTYGMKVELSDIDKVISDNPQITGISFSGGEPFIFIDKIEKWSKYLTEKYPNIYKWIYTNGVYVNDETLERLSKVGLQEIRFDAAATNYSRTTIERIKLAKKYFEVVSIEVAALPWFTDLLNGCLVELEEYITYLNLHTLQVHRGLNWERLMESHPELNNLLTYADKRYGREESIQSALETYKTIRFVKDNDLDIIINDCGAFNMANQQVGWQYQKNNSDGYIYETWKDFRQRAKDDGMLP